MTDFRRSPCEPALYVQELGALQNLPSDAHATVALLARWILNAAPNGARVRDAVRRFGVGPEAAKGLRAFRTACARRTAAAK